MTEFRASGSARASAQAILRAENDLFDAIRCIPMEADGTEVSVLRNEDPEGNEFVVNLNMRAAMDRFYQFLSEYINDRPHEKKMLIRARLLKTHLELFLTLGYQRMPVDTFRPSAYAMTIEDTWGGISITNFLRNYSRIYGLFFVKNRNRFMVSSGDCRTLGYPKGCLNVSQIEMISTWLYECSRKPLLEEHKVTLRKSIDQIELGKLEWQKIIDNVVDLGNTKKTFLDAKVMPGMFAFERGDKGIYFRSLMVIPFLSRSVALLPEINTLSSCRRWAAVQIEEAMRNTDGCVCNFDEIDNGVRLFAGRKRLPGSYDDLVPYMIEYVAKMKEGLYPFQGETPTQISAAGREEISIADMFRNIRTNPVRREGELVATYLLRFQSFNPEDICVFLFWCAMTAFETAVDSNAIPDVISERVMDMISFRPGLLLNGESGVGKSILSDSFQRLCAVDPVPIHPHGNDQFFLSALCRKTSLYCIQDMGKPKRSEVSQICRALLPAMTNETIALRIMREDSSKEGRVMEQRGLNDDPRPTFAMWGNSICLSEKEHLRRWLVFNFGTSIQEQDTSFQHNARNEMAKFAWACVCEYVAVRAFIFKKDNPLQWLTKETVSKINSWFHNADSLVRFLNTFTEDDREKKIPVDEKLFDRIRQWKNSSTLSDIRSGWIPTNERELRTCSQSLTFFQDHRGSWIVGKTWKASASRLDIDGISPSFRSNGSESSEPAYNPSWEMEDINNF